MANQITLMEYLQVGPPSLPIIDHPSVRNTRSTSYSYRDITGILPWEEFDLPHLQERHGTLLSQAMIDYDAMARTPARVVTSEESLRSRFTSYLQTRIRRSYRAGFEHLQSTSTMPRNMTVMSFGEHSDARPIQGDFKPDCAIFEIAAAVGSGPNRAPGEMKPSYNWTSDMSFGSPGDQTEFKQALSQLNFYMKSHGTRFGFLLTDKELVAVKRSSQSGVLHLADAVGWTAHGSVDRPQMTVALALWYLGMLAADDLGWAMQ